MFFIGDRVLWTYRVRDNGVRGTKYGTIIRIHDTYVTIRIWDKHYQEHYIRQVNPKQLRKANEMEMVA